MSKGNVIKGRDILKLANNKKVAYVESLEQELEFKILSVRDVERETEELERKLEKESKTYNTYKKFSEYLKTIKE